MAEFRFPNSSHRTTIVGRTGSGKTQFGVWLLSQSTFDRPYIVFDFKGDDLINSIPYAKQGSLYDVPTDAGLYIVKPNSQDNEAVENLLRKIWERENIGVYIDEGYKIDKDSPAFNDILTQGRSKNISTITLSQRPSWVSRFVFSEADYYAIFHLNDKRDQKTVEQFFPSSVEQRLPDYNCRWYDVGQDENFRLLPVPDRDTILLTFDKKLGAIEADKPKRRVFI